MFPDVADNAAGVALAPVPGDETGIAACERRATRPDAYKVTRGLGLNMANNPKKGKDPTEVALSAIQEALNIGDSSNSDSDRETMRDDSMRSDISAPIPPPPVFNEPSFDVRDNRQSAAERPVFEPI